MSFDALIRKATRIADRLTTSMKVTVRHRAVTRDSAGEIVTTPPYGTPVYATAVTRTALWEDEAQLLKLPGQEVIGIGRLTFLVPGLVIDERDELTVNGLIQPILRVDRGLRSDLGTYAITVWLGASQAQTAGGQ